MDTINPNNLPYLEIDAIRQSLQHFQNDFSQRLKNLDAAYIKIYDVLAGNNINAYILDHCKRRIISDYIIFYEIFDKNYQFTIKLLLNHFKNKKIEPMVGFLIKNNKTKLIIEDLFPIYGLEHSLQPKFSVLFKNNFTSFYRK